VTNSEGDEVDRIGTAAKAEQMQSLEIVYKYNIQFQEALRLYNILPPSIESAATAHIQDQIEIIEKIIANGLAYTVNGSVYFNVKKFKTYFFSE
jgi:cysteinyl-tRNA synthetase